ncbi:MAG: hypothetical protein COB67_12250 [SAR324 cluster bacterium]|uniref:Uncharacterized protein n=1 Tax=SAR324 cluster bacterium TaxID=2024889 RepID=A0A2A4SRV0_9DELT|nr:MAG: hypothetical protein COB67_12250 [SAR324 cluster bacterium]
MSVVEESILKSIQKNGFPEKMVQLPFRSIFNSCKKHGVKLSDVLKQLHEQQVYSEIGEEKILFFREKPVQKQEQDSDQQATDPMGGMPDDFFKTAMDQMKNMDPEQLKQVKEQVMNMSPQERSELMNKAKGMFGKK